MRCARLLAALRRVANPIARTRIARTLSGKRTRIASFAVDTTIDSRPIKAASGFTKNSGQLQAGGGAPDHTTLLLRCASRAATAARQHRLHDYAAATKVRFRMRRMSGRGAQRDRQRLGPLCRASKLVERARAGEGERGKQVGDKAALVEARLHERSRALRAAPTSGVGGAQLAGQTRFSLEVADASRRDADLHLRQVSPHATSASALDARTTLIAVNMAALGGLNVIVRNKRQKQRLAGHLQICSAPA